MAGIFGALLAFLRKAIGTTADTESTTGTVLARLKYLLTHGAMKVGSLTSAYLQTTSTSYQTVIDVTGAGELLCIMVVMAAGMCHLDAYVKITVDGAAYEMISNEASSPGAVYLYPQAISYIWGTTTLAQLTADFRPQYAHIKYKTSLKVELKTESGGNPTLNLIYVKE